MRALTLHQPWATLVALGAKPVETRGWATSYRGPLAIHAGKRRPPLMHLPPLSRGRSEADREHDHQTWLCIDTITDPKYQGPQPTGKRIPRWAQTPTLFFPHAGPFGKPNEADGTRKEATVYLPLGFVLATCTLVDVVPVEELGWTELWQGWAWQGPGGSCERVAHSRDDPAGGRHVVVHVSQRGLGDFSPGRYAWLLADIEPTEPPVPARGYQHLWEWTKEGSN